jgi:hypothetical protein
MPLQLGDLISAGFGHPGREVTTGEADRARGQVAQPANGAAGRQEAEEDSNRQRREEQDQPGLDQRLDRSRWQTGGTLERRLNIDEGEQLRLVGPGSVRPDAVARLPSTGEDREDGGGRPGDPFRSRRVTPATRSSTTFRRTPGSVSPAPGRTGEVVFEPGPVRVVADPVPLGAPLSPGAPVLRVTGTKHLVTIQIDVSRQGVVNPGDAVGILMPDGTTTANGHLASISRVASQPAGSYNNNQGGPPQAATVDATVTLEDETKAGTLDLAPVTDTA